MDSNRVAPKPGDTVVIATEPKGLLSGLPQEDRVAIAKVIGTPILLVSYDKDGRAELKFNGNDGVVHFIYVDHREIKLFKQRT